MPVLKLKRRHISSTQLMKVKLNIVWRFAELPPGLEECACECYSVIREYIASGVRPERRTPPQGVVL
jgi:hypothetical protein